MTEMEAAKSAASDEQIVDLAREVQLACFCLGEEYYAINIMKIREIIRPLRITPVPKAPDFVDGVINLRGIIIPVIDMRARFGLESRDGDENERMIVVSVESRLVALVVDSISEVMRVVVGEIQPPRFKALRKRLAPQNERGIEWDAPSRLVRAAPAVWSVF